MLTINEVNSILIQAGPLNDEIEAVSRVGDNAWEIEFESLILALEYDAEQGRLVFEGDIGSVPEQRRAEIQEAMLNYNALWRETGGLRLAVAGESITSGLVAEVAATFAERVLLWQALLTSNATFAEADKASLTAMSTDPMFIRI